ncbi:FecR family protein [Sphingobacterium suaedae]|uniref:FecR family protein n=1 Tax=Sphingobacterium suaedae TaxID=1686402 RepID=A0ABW5KF05_9SPHI
MQDDKELFIRLLSKKIHETISDQEQVVLDRLFHSIPEGEQNRLFNEMLDTDSKEAYVASSALDSTAREEVIQRIFKDNRLGPQKSTKSRPIVYRRWISVAACLVILCLGSWIFWPDIDLKTDSENVVAGIGEVEDLSPGGERAIVKTQDGNYFALDSIEVGGTATGPNFKIVRLLTGDLQYQSLGGSTMHGRHTISTPRGGTVNFILPDGTKVWLNAASSLVFNLNMNTADRIVEITGEVYFEVSKRRQQRFIVKSTLGEIEVLGTKFNVNTYKRDKGEVGLLEGSIRLKTEKAVVNMRPSELTTISADGSLRTASRKDIQQIVMWKQGIFNFQNANAYQVADELSRWYDIQVKVKGGVSHHQINGQIRKDLTLSKMLDMLDYLGLAGSYRNNELIINVKNEKPM